MSSPMYTSSSAYPLGSLRGRQPQGASSQMGNPAPAGFDPYSLSAPTYHSNQPGHGAPSQTDNPVPAGFNPYGLSASNNRYSLPVPSTPSQVGNPIPAGFNPYGPSASNHPYNLPVRRASSYAGPMMHGTYQNGLGSPFVGGPFSSHASSLGENAPHSVQNQWETHQIRHTVRNAELAIGHDRQVLQDHEDRLKKQWDQSDTHDATIMNHTAQLKDVHVKLWAIKEQFENNNSHFDNHKLQLKECHSQLWKHGNSLQTVEKCLQTLAAQMQALHEQFKADAGTIGQSVDDCYAANRSVVSALTRHVESGKKFQAELMQHIAHESSRVKSLESAIENLTRLVLTIAKDTPQSPVMGAGQLLIADSAHASAEAASSSVQSDTQQSESASGQPTSSPNITHDFASTESHLAHDEMVGKLLTNLFKRVEVWSEQFGTMPTASVWQSTAFVKFCEENIGRRGMVRTSLDTPSRPFFVSSVVNRVLATNILKSNVFEGFDDNLARQYGELRREAHQYWQDHGLEIIGRGRRCNNMAAVASAVVKQNGFEEHHKVQVSRETRLLTALMSSLVKPDQRDDAERELRVIVDEAYRAATRMAEQKFEYDIRFVKYGDRYDEPTMLYRDPELVADDSKTPTSFVYMVRLNITPAVKTKIFRERLAQGIPYRGHVLLALKRDAERGSWKNRANNAGGSQINYTRK